MSFIDWVIDNHKEFLEINFSAGKSPWGGVVHPIKEHITTGTYEDLTTPFSTFILYKIVIASRVVRLSQDFRKFSGAR